MSAAPFFSVVIPTCDRPNALAACLEKVAVSARQCRGVQVELIVTDDGSDRSARVRLAQDFTSVQWTAGPRRGPAANRNHGASLARGTWLAFADDDCLPEVGWLSAFAAEVDNPGVAVLEGRTYASGPRRHPLDECPINDAGGNLWACNFAIRRDLFQKIGGFDERFPFASMEDTELRLRLEALGCSPRFVPAAAVLHPWRRIMDWRRHHRRQMKSRLVLEERHPGKAFAASAPRLLGTYARIAARDHGPFLLRHPLEGLRVLPGIWVGFARTILWRWRRPSAAEFEV